MFTPLKMKKVSVQVLSEDAPLAALALAECGAFNPEIIPALQEELPEFPGERYRDLYKSGQSYLDRILSHCGLAVDPLPPESLRRVEEKELAELDTWLQQIWAKCSECQEGMRRIAEEHKHIDQLMQTLDRFAALDIDLELLQQGKQFIDVRIGTVPEENVERLREALSLAGVLFDAFLVTDGTAQVIAAGSAGNESEVDIILDAAGWRTLHIPADFNDRPEKVRQRLIKRREEVVEQNAVQCRMMEQTTREFRDRLIAAAHLLALAAPFGQMGDALRSRGSLASVSGWVPAREIKRCKQVLPKHLGGCFVFNARDPLPDERMQVPSVMHSHWLLKPFVSLVQTYGIPRYGEFDPTLLFGVTFILMYGMMFGDVGHGAVIAVAGLMMHRLLKHFTVFVVAVGLSSVVFGFLYGSIFGYEHVLHPLWMSPLSDPMRMLTLALLWGVGFIVLAIILTIINRIIDGHYKEALLDRRGVTGLIFYIGMLNAAYRVATGKELGMVAIAAVLVPYAVILGVIWHENKTNLGERILIVVVEGFETIINYVSNTLSFLRVAAFSLNHVALAIAVFTLAGMLGTAGHWITVLLGNVFIIVFEGAIVAIQVLRLEYYEGFSRFFSGDGREFRPMILTRWTAQKLAPKTT